MVYLVFLIDMQRFVPEMPGKIKLDILPLLQFVKNSLLQNLGFLMHVLEDSDLEMMPVLNQF